MPSHFLATENIGARPVVGSVKAYHRSRLEHKQTCIPARKMFFYGAVSTNKQENKGEGVHRDRHIIYT